MWLSSIVISYTDVTALNSIVVIVSVKKSPTLSICTTLSLKSSITNKLSPICKPSERVFHVTSSSLKVAKGLMFILIRKVQMVRQNIYQVSSILKRIIQNISTDLLMNLSVS